MFSPDDVQVISVGDSAELFLALDPNYENIPTPVHGIPGYKGRLYFGVKDPRTIVSVIGEDEYKNLNLPNPGIYSLELGEDSEEGTPITPSEVKNFVDLDFIIQGFSKLLAQYEEFNSLTELKILDFSVSGKWTTIPESPLRGREPWVRVSLRLSASADTDTAVMVTVVDQCLSLSAYDEVSGTFGYPTPKEVISVHQLEKTAIKLGLVTSRHHHNYGNPETLNCYLTSPDLPDLSAIQSAAISPNGNHLALSWTPADPQAEQGGTALVASLNTPTLHLGCYNFQNLESAGGLPRDERKDVEGSLCEMSIGQFVEFNSEGDLFVGTEGGSLKLHHSYLP